MFFSVFLRFQAICPGLTPKLKAIAAARAFRGSRVWLKNFILEDNVEHGLYAKKIIDELDAHHNNMDLEIRKCKILDAVECRLKRSHNSDDFYTVLEVFYAEPSLHDVVERLMEEYGEPSVCFLPYCARSLSTPGSYCSHSVHCNISSVRMLHNLYMHGIFTTMQDFIIHVQGSPQDLFISVIKKLFFSNERYVTNEKASIIRSGVWLHSANTKDGIVKLV